MVRNKGPEPKTPPLVEEKGSSEPPSDNPEGSEDQSEQSVKDDTWSVDDSSSDDPSGSTQHFEVKSLALSTHHFVSIPLGQIHHPYIKHPGDYVIHRIKQKFGQDCLLLAEATDSLLSFILTHPGTATEVEAEAKRIVSVLQDPPDRLHLAGVGGLNRSQLTTFLRGFGEVINVRMISKGQVRDRNFPYGTAALVSIRTSKKIPSTLSYLSNSSKRSITISQALTSSSHSRRNSAVPVAPPRHGPRVTPAIPERAILPPPARTTGRPFRPTRGSRPSQTHHPSRTWLNPVHEDDRKKTQGMQQRQQSQTAPKKAAPTVPPRPRNTNLHPELQGHTYKIAGLAFIEESKTPKKPNQNESAASSSVSLSFNSSSDSSQEVSTITHVGGLTMVESTAKPDRAEVQRKREERRQRRSRRKGAYVSDSDDRAHANKNFETPTNSSASAMQGETHSQ